jgi:hypothetical protein
VTEAAAMTMTAQGIRTSMMNAMEKGGAVDRIDIRTKSTDSIIESMRAVRPAAEKHYAALTAEQ